MAAEPRSRRAGLLRDVRLLFAVVVLVHCILAVSALLRPAADDVPRYFAIAVAHGRPYLDYPVEYPLVAVLLFKLIGSLATDMDSFGRLLVALNIAADVTVAFLLWRAWNPRVCLVYLALVSPLLVLVLTKVDLLVCAVALTAVVAARRRRAAVFGVAIAVGTGIKVWPGFLGLALVAISWVRSGRRLLAWMAVALLVYLVASVLYGGTSSLQQVVSFRGATHPQIESTIGAVGRLFTSPGAVLENVAWRVAALPGWLDTFGSAASFALGILGAGLVGRWRGTAGVGWVATISLVLVAAPVLSPQYIVWLVPAAAIALDERSPWTVAVAAVVVALTWAISATYASVIAGTVPAQILVVGRDVALAALAVVALRWTYAHRPTTPQALLDRSPA